MGADGWFCRRLNRFKGRDYSKPGVYFVTICTHNHGKYFGEVVGKEMILNSCGRIAYKFWKQIPKLYRNMGVG